MASTLALPFLSEMTKICSNSLGVPIHFPIDEDGLATITALHISIRFGLQDTSVSVEREVYDPLILTLSYTIPEASKLSNDGTIIDSFGLSSLAGTGSMALLVLRCLIRLSLLSLVNPPLVLLHPPIVRIKIEP